MLDSVGFDALLFAPEVRPEVGIGFDLEDVALTLRGNLLFIGLERVRVGEVWGSLDNASPFVGAAVQGLFCNGSIADLSLAELRANCALRHGEAIPTLNELLSTIIEETELEALYLDMKVPEGVLPCARRVSAALLVEYDPDLVSSEGCVAWGPTWTAGPRVTDVNELRAKGAATIYWTINQSDFIDEFLQRAHPDGIISGRSALLFHRYQKIGTPPTTALRSTR